MGSDGGRAGIATACVVFQSTLPGWGATHPTGIISTAKPLFQSTLPGWGATVAGQGHARHTAFQSTLPGWGATSLTTAGGSLFEFQSTLPGWGATRLSSDNNSRSKFQSTLPGWGATIDRIPSWTVTFYFNPRSPDGERQTETRNFDDSLSISIHAPRMGSDVRPMR